MHKELHNNLRDKSFAIAEASFYLCFGENSCLHGKAFMFGDLDH